MSECYNSKMYVVLVLQNQFGCGIFIFYFFFLQYLKIGFINYPWTCTLNLFFLIIECQIELQCTKCI